MGGDFIEKVQARRINSKYSLLRKLGSGGFGAVYLGQDFDTGEQVALKLEHRDRQPFLEEEKDAYAIVQGLPGFPAVYWYGWLDDYKAMAFELLGPSLEDLFKYCGGRFTLKTTLMIVDQLLCRLEDLHLRGLLHCDIKPRNCLMGTGRNGNTVYMTDFGLAREYDANVNEPVEAQSGQPRLIGTVRYASIRGHMGQGQSPRDDLESLGYMIVYFIHGKLPWQGLKARNSTEQEQMVMEKKVALDMQTLCTGLPQEFVEYTSYVKSLSYEDMPDYTRLRQMFRRVANTQNIEYDHVFDWTVSLYLQGRTT